jgi:PilZ domain
LRTEAPGHRGTGYDSDAMELPRRAERVSVDAFVKVRGDGHELVFRTRDVSENGVFLYTKVTRAYPFRVGSTLSLELFGYDQTVRCTALVVRVVDPGSAEAEHFPTGFGVRILEADDDARSSLTALIERIKLDGGAY